MRGIACYHHLVNHLSIFAQSDVHLGFGGCGYGVEANVRDDQFGATLHSQCEVAVEVGDGCVRRSFLGNGGANNGLAVGLLHHTLHGKLLGKGHSAHH